MTYNLTGSIQWSSSQAQQLFGIAFNKLREQVFSNPWVIIRYGSQPYYAFVVNLHDDQYMEIRLTSSYNGNTIDLQYFTGSLDINSNGYIYLTDSQFYSDGCLPLEYVEASYLYDTKNISSNNFQFRQFSDGVISIALICTLIFTALSLFLRRLF